MELPIQSRGAPVVVHDADFKEERKANQRYKPDDDLFDFLIGICKLQKQNPMARVNSAPTLMGRRKSMLSAVAAPRISARAVEMAAHTAACFPWPPRKGTTKAVDMRKIRSKL